MVAIWAGLVGCSGQSPEATENQNLRKQVDELKADVREAQAKAHERDDRIAELHGELDDARGQIEVLTQRLAPAPIEVPAEAEATDFVFRMFSDQVNELPRDERDDAWSLFHRIRKSVGLLSEDELFELVMEPRVNQLYSGVLEEAFDEVISSGELLSPDWRDPLRDIFLTAHKLMLRKGREVTDLIRSGYTSRVEYDKFARAVYLGDESAVRDAREDALMKYVLDRYLRHVENGTAEELLREAGGVTEAERTEQALSGMTDREKARALEIQDKIKRDVLSMTDGDFQLIASSRTVNNFTYAGFIAAVNNLVQEQQHLADGHPEPWNEIFRTCKALELRDAEGVFRMCLAVYSPESKLTFPKARSKARRLNGASRSELERLKNDPVFGAVAQSLLRQRK